MEFLIGTFAAFQTDEVKEKVKEWGRKIKNKNDIECVDVPKEIQIKITNYAYNPPAAKAAEFGNTEAYDG